jgi:hypothetical protein
MLQHHGNIGWWVVMSTARCSHCSMQWQRTKCGTSITHGTGKVPTLLRSFGVYLFLQIKLSYFKMGYTHFLTYHSSSQTITILRYMIISVSLTKEHYVSLETNCKQSCMLCRKYNSQYIAHCPISTFQTQKPGIKKTVLLAVYQCYVL